MSDVRHWLYREPPAVLYHYTTQAGLLGIIERRQIWATHTQYLNDVREFTHAVDIVRDVIKSMNTPHLDAKRKKCLGEMNEALETDIESTNVCVCSFSSEGDVLSQWRAYGGGAAGFSLGFSGEFLQACARALRFRLVQCIYDESEQRHFIEALVRNVLDENYDAVRDIEDRDTEDEPFVPGGNLVPYLYRYAPIIKHKAFAEEREWRIISRPLMAVHQDFAYRPGLSMLIPYYKITLDSDANPFALQRVVIGPTPNPERSIRSLRTFLFKHGQRSCEIARSDAPYRAW